MFDVFDFIERMFIGILLLLAVYVLAFWDEISDDLKSSSQPVQMVAAGSLESVNLTTGILKDVSTLILADGTRIRVKGAVSPWKPGAAVQHPASETDSKKQKIDNTQWCISEKCYPEIF
ncbi:hypothetical protein [Pantoea ananatis]|uniref:hypothetical protein n=1 Tax=Pantoea ananas TaxID=553 RepID=UPI0021E99FC1|nr:hypothetical protein [Pantoea ananatis]MCW0309943.1 hypothetical protein [Pantoea ananatis]MCW0341643.1 hypothetical protein [Pantoea ananatis]MCW0360143.1 hypothetical protein [Pantoea ananatis]MCW0364738.1 hypothetical protein [Pantoea ananatis]MCW1777390.1 hypothetical protein [Pantoea ananatis]